MGVEVIQGDFSANLLTRNRNVSIIGVRAGFTTASRLYQSANERKGKMNAKMNYVTYEYKTEEIAKMIAKALRKLGGKGYRRGNRVKVFYPSGTCVLDIMNKVHIITPPGMFGDVVDYGEVK